MLFCTDSGSELKEGEKPSPQCGTPVAPSKAEPEGKRIRTAEKRPTSSVAVIFIIVTVVVVGAGEVAVSLGYWQPSGHVVGSGSLVTENKDFTDFSVVEAGWGSRSRSMMDRCIAIEVDIEVEIIQSDSYSVSITADDNVLGLTEVSKTGNTLTIGLKWGYSYTSVTLIAKITMPDLRELELSGGTHGTVGGFTTSPEFVLELSGGSSIVIEGAASDLRVDASGGSQLELSDFHVQDASVNLCGGSRATINLDGRLDANVSGGSHLWYMGDPTMGDIEPSGGSTIERK